jgi:GDP-L-fucose synthase
MKTILITGGTGLVGTAIKKISHLYPQYNFIFSSSQECNLLSFDDTYKYFNNIKPYYVIHLAANVGGLFKNMNNKVTMLEKNILINTNVLQVSYLCNVEKLITCLSTCIFPDNTTYPINETMLHNGPPHNSNDSYAYSKRLLEIHCKAYQENYNKNFFCIIPTNIYGCNDNFNLEDSHVIPALIHKCYLSKINNQPFIIAGSGKPLRQFIYSEDLAKLIIFCLNNYDDKESIILSVSPENEITIKDIALIIAKKFNQNNIIFDNNLPDGQFKKTADNSKLLLLLKKYNCNFNFTDITDGIDTTIEWFLNNYITLRK